MAPPPPFGANSAAARDIANVLHPYTDLKAHLEVGPGGDHPRQGRAGLGRRRQGLHRERRRPVVRRLGFDNERLVQAAANQMRKLPFYHAFTAKSHEPMIELAEMLIAARAGADEQGVLRQFRLRGERHRDQAGLVPQQRARPAATRRRSSAG